MQQMNTNGSFKMANLQRINSSGKNYVPFILTSELLVGGIVRAADF